MPMMPLVLLFSGRVLFCTIKLTVLCLVVLSDVKVYDCP